MSQSKNYNDTAVLTIEQQVETQKTDVKISPLERMVRGEVVKCFSILVKNMPNEKLGTLIDIAREDVKSQLSSICYNI